jgi:hypothetical protein
MKSWRVCGRWYKLELKKTQWVYEHSASIQSLKNPYVAKYLSLLHDKYVIVFVDKAPINIVFVGKSHYITLRN